MIAGMQSHKAHDHLHLEHTNIINKWQYLDDIRWTKCERENKFKFYFLTSINERENKFEFIFSPQ